MKKATYICLEGVEGVGKTTQTKKIVEFLRNQGFSVLETKEPGTPHSPLTMELRNIMLNAKYESEMTTLARELVSQAIRSIHIENIIVPALHEYDFIIQDRGILSGLAYGDACGNDIRWLLNMSSRVVPEAFPEILGDPTAIYDSVILLTGNVKKGLTTALSSKKEFEAGDAIEMKGLSFMEQVNRNMVQYSQWFNTSRINVDGKNIDAVFENIIDSLVAGDINVRRT